MTGPEPLRGRARRHPGPFGAAHPLALALLALLLAAPCVSCVACVASRGG